MLNKGFDRRPVKHSDKPRKVRGGVRLRATEWPPKLNWAGRRWIDLLSRSAMDSVIRAGFEYGTAGQTRAIEVIEGRIAASVQGTELRAYRTSIEVELIPPSQWDRVLQSMSDQALYSAKLLSGELPETIDEVFAPLGLNLFPEPGQIVPRCTCAEAARAAREAAASQAIGAGVSANRPATGWCKHTCCAMLLAAELIEHNPLILFTLRGLRPDDLADRLRTVRATGQKSVALELSPGMPHISTEAPPLEECVDRFWNAGPGLWTIETPIRKPEVSHPLLRRLGPSPFKDGKFPLVGLLATCYDVISEAVVKQESGMIDD